MSLDILNFKLEKLSDSFKDAGKISLHEYIEGLLQELSKDQTKALGEIADASSRFEDTAILTTQEMILWHEIFHLVEGLIEVF